MHLTKSVCCGRGTEMIDLVLELQFLYKKRLNLKKEHSSRILLCFESLLCIPLWTWFASLCLYFYWFFFFLSEQETTWGWWICVRKKTAKSSFLFKTHRGSLTVSVPLKDFKASDQLQQMWHGGSVPKILSTCMFSLKVAGRMEDRLY